MSVFEYKAFISYSHRDARWAQWLLTALETYRLPESKTRGVGRIFRDRDEAGAATDLKDEIQRALLASEHLIVIASPASARSKYVQAEIEAFAEANKTRPIPGRILTLIIDGEPNVSLDVQHERECFPPALRGGVLKPDGTPYEPLAADARPVGDGRTRALAKLVAGLMDIRYDTLVRRDLQRRQRRRLFVGMTTAGALAIAAVVSMVIVSGNVEQANLRTAREAAERDARTVTAVNSAERARRLLESGNRRGAVTLARGSLANDGTLPFIPQAYSVLYGALFQSGAPISLELGSAGPDDAITRMLANGDFVSVGGKLAVWSTDGGVSYTREGLSTGSFVALAPDRTALFIKNFPSTGVLRYRPGARGWDLLDDFEAVIQSDILRDAPQTYVAIDNRTLAGCYYETLAVISFPETGDGLGNADLTKELGYSCTVLALTDKQTLLIADDWEGTVREYDLTGEATGRAYATGDTSVLWARAYKDVVIVGAIGNTYAFARETQTLIDSYPETSSPKSVSPAGTIMLESGYSIDATGPVIHDLVAKTKRPLNCQLCSTIGFPDEDTVLMLGEDHRAVLALDIHSGRPKQDLFAFEQRVEEAELLEDGRTVLGIRPSSVSSAVTLDQPSRDVTVVAGPGPYLVQAKFAGPDTVVTQVAQGSNVPMQTVLHLYRAEPRGAEISSPDLVVPGGVSQIDRLPNDLFSVFDGDSIFSAEGPLRVFDAETGKLVFRKDLRTPARSFADGRFLLVADGTEFGVFDTQTREYGPIDAGAGIDALTVWSVTSNALTVIRDKTAKVFTLDDKGAQLRNSFTLATPPLIACLAEDARTLYLYDFSQEQPFLAKVDAETGEEQARVSFTIPEEEEDSDLVDLLFDSAMSSSRPDRALHCSADSVVIRSEMYRLAGTWIPPADTITIGPLTEDRPPFDRPVREGPLAVEHLDSAVLAHSDVDAMLMDTETKEPLLRVSPEQSRIASATWAAAPGLVAMGLDNGRLQIWRATAASATMVDLVAHVRPVDEMDVSADGRLLLTGDSGGTVKLWPLMSVEDLLAEETLAGTP